MTLPGNANYVRVRGYWFAQAGGGHTGTIKFAPRATNLTDLAAFAYIKPAAITVTPDPTTAYFFADLLATDDPDLTPFAWTVTLRGETPVTINVPYTAPVVDVGAGVMKQAIWLTNAATITPPTPAATYYTSAQTDLAIASVVAGVPEQAQDATAAMIAAGTQTGITFSYNDAGNALSATVTVTGDLAEFSSSAQTAAVGTPTTMVGKLTRYDTTSAPITQPFPAALAGAVVSIGWDAGTNALTLTAAGADVFGSGSTTSVVVPAVGEVITYHCTNAGRWRVVSGFKTQTSLDARYFQQSNTLLGPRASGNGLTPLGSRPGHYRAELSNGTDTGSNSRIRQIAPFDAADIVLAFSNFYSGENSTSIGAMTISAGIELPSGTIVPVWFPSTTTGAPSRTLTMGTTTAPIVYAMPAGIELAKGDVWWIRTRVTVTSGQKWFATLNAHVGDGEGFETGTATTDKTLSGTITNAAGACYAPIGVFAQSAVPHRPASVALVGDSRSFGVGEDSGDTTDYGYQPRTLGCVFGGTPIVGLVRGERPGSTAALFVVPSGTQGAYYRMAALGAAKYVWCLFGINDLNGGGAGSAPTVKANLTKVWFKGYRRNQTVYQDTLLPWTTSTDAWSTTGNQTVTVWEADRTAVNDWIRAGAPLDPTAFTPVAIGTSGALLAGVSGHPLKGYFEAADLGETARNSGFWKSAGSGAGGAYTTDGIHPATFGATAVASGLAATAAARFVAGAQY